MWFWDGVPSGQGAGSHYVAHAGFEVTILLFKVPCVGIVGVPLLTASIGHSKELVADASDIYNSCLN
jgi:hypothetical protein